MVTHILSGKFVSSGPFIHMKRRMNVHELILVLEGEVYLAEGDNKFVAKKGDLVFFKANNLHYGWKKSLSNVSFYWIHFISQEEIEFENCYTLKDSSFLCQLFKLVFIFETYSQKDASIAATLLVHAAKKAVSQTQVCHNAVIENVLSYIDANIHKKLTVSDIALKFGYHKDYISKKVKEYTGMSLKKYITSLKLKLAKELLLDSDKSVKEICACCGFSDYKQFLKLFKKTEGVTPSVYRNTYFKTFINTV